MRSLTQRIDVEIILAATGYPAVGRCVLGKLRTWRFPRPRGGKPVVVRYPILLRAAG